MPLMSKPTPGQVPLGQASNGFISGTFQGDISVDAAGNTAALTVGGASAASIAFAVDTVADATSGNFPGTLVLRDGSGNASVNQLTANTVVGTVSFASSAGTLSSPLTVALGGSGSNMTSAVGVLQKTNGGNFTAGAVNLASQVTGNLPVANLGSGTSANLGSFWNGSGAWLQSLFATPAVTADLSSVSAQALYTVPAGRTFIPLFLLLLGDAPITGAPAGSVGTNSPTYDNIYSINIIPATLDIDDYAPILLTGVITSVSGTKVINFLATTPAASGLMLVRILGLLL